MRNKKAWIFWESRRKYWDYSVISLCVYGNPCSYGSEGECRTAALTLRLAMLQLLRKQHQGRGVTILVDDVLGELDQIRQDAFLEQISQAGQLLFAGTALPKAFPAPRVFTVENGTLRE